MEKNTALTPTAQALSPARSASPFLNVPAEIAQHPGLSHSARLVYGALNRLHKINAKRGKNAFQVSQERLAQQIGRSVRTVKRTLYELRGKPDADGVPQFKPLVVVIGSGRCNWYRVLELPEPSTGGKAPEGPPDRPAKVPDAPLPPGPTNDVPESPVQGPETPCQRLPAVDGSPDPCEADDVSTPASVAQAAAVDNSPGGYKNQRCERPKMTPSRERQGRGIQQELMLGTMPADAPTRQVTPNSQKSTEQRGFERLATDKGRQLIGRLILLYYDWHVQNPELTPLHRANRQRKNRRDVALFTGRYGLSALAWAVDKCERTSLADGAAVLRHIVCGGLFANERRRIDERLRTAA